MSDTQVTPMSDAEKFLRSVRSRVFDEDTHLKVFMCIKEWIGNQTIGDVAKMTEERRSFRERSSTAERNLPLRILDAVDTLLHSAVTSCGGGGFDINIKSGHPTFRNTDVEAAIHVLRALFSCTATVQGPYLRGQFDDVLHLERFMAFEPGHYTKFQVEHADLKVAEAKRAVETVRSQVQEILKQNARLEQLGAEFAIRTKEVAAAEEHAKHIKDRAMYIRKLKKRFRRGEDDGAKKQRV